MKLWGSLDESQKNKTEDCQEIMGSKHTVMYPKTDFDYLMCFEICNIHRTRLNIHSVVQT